MKAGIAAKPKRMFLTTIASLLSNRYVSTLYDAVLTRSLESDARPAAELRVCARARAARPHRRLGAHASAPAAARNRNAGARISRV